LFLNRVLEQKSTISKTCYKATKFAKTALEKVNSMETGIIISPWKGKDKNNKSTVSKGLDV